MQKIDRCVKCDGDVLWMEFKKSLCCVWCGLHYDEKNQPNEKETPPYDNVSATTAEIKDATALLKAEKARKANN